MAPGGTGTSPVPGDVLDRYSARATAAATRRSRPSRSGRARAGAPETRSRTAGRPVTTPLSAGGGEGRAGMNRPGQIKFFETLFLSEDSSFHSAAVASLAIAVVA